jgi:hypothetical protein
MCGKKIGDCRGYMLTYPIRCVRPEGGNINDQEIDVYFDDPGRLYQFSFGAMPPLVGDVVDRGVVPGTDVEYFFTRPPAR